jgi:hypothetical protein
MIARLREREQDQEGEGGSESEMAPTALKNDSKRKLLLFYCKIHYEY